jgi:hypothetical protein
MEPREPDSYCCPCCGEELPETIVTGADGSVLGCEMCLGLRDAYDYFHYGEGASRW